MAERRVIPLARPSDANRPPAIDVRAVRVVQGGKVVLSTVDFSLSHGGITALIGPNGSGKSTLLRVMAGLVRPDQGTVELDPTMLAPAIVFQRPVLLRRSVRANLLHTLRLLRVPRPDRGERVAELLDAADLSRQANAPARLLSGGEQQRLALARALASDPNLLLLDEPTAHLDPSATAAIEAMILRAAGQGAKVVLVTHDRTQAERLAGDVVFLNAGRVLEQGPARAFFNGPASPAAAAYLAGRLTH